MVLAPVVGVVIGGVAAGVIALAQLVKPEADLLAAVVGVLVIAALSGADCTSTGWLTSRMRSGPGGIARPCCGS